MNTIFGLLLTAAFIFSFPVSTHAELLPLENRELDQIAGNGGFSMAIKNVQVFEFINTFRYCGSDNGGIQLSNIKIHDGASGPYHVNFDFGTLTSTGIIHFDIGEPTVASVDDRSGNPPTSISRGMTGMIAPNWDQDITYTVGNFYFADPTNPLGAVDLGALELGPINITSFQYYTSPPIEGSGIDWEHDFQLIIDHATYAYQFNGTNCEKIILTDFYMGHSFADLVGDDPRFPSTWKPNNNVDFGQFKIGDLFGDLSNNIPSTPARFNVGEADIYGTGTIYGMVGLQLPMTGSIRFENVRFGSTDFGPGAIDGIQVYRLEAQLVP